MELFRAALSYSTYLLSMSTVPDTLAKPTAVLYTFSKRTSYCILVVLFLVVLHVCGHSKVTHVVIGVYTSFYISDCPTNHGKRVFSAPEFSDDTDFFRTLFSVCYRMFILVNVQ